MTKRKAKQAAPMTTNLPREFGYGAVELLPSRYRDQALKAAATYGGLDEDMLLKGFRRQAGLPAPGPDMAGWCSATSAVIFGQIVSGLVRLGKALHQPELVEKAIRLYRGWRETLPDDGNAKMRLYDWEKLVQGLADLHLIAGVDTLADLKLTTQWAERTFDRTRPPADGHDFWGAGANDTSEWYILPEVFYRLHLGTGDAYWKNFADLWLYHDYWKPFETSAAPATVLPVHAYSHVNSFSSAAMAYAATGERKFLDICINGHDFVQATQAYATGAYGPDERLMPPDGSLGRSLDCCAYHAEVPCGTWAGFKLSRYLMTFTGDGRFGDWIETLLYNAIGAALPLQPDGKAFYYGDYRLSAGTKDYYWQEWPCCSGTYIQDMAEYHNLAFFHDDAGLYVNLYLPAKVSWGDVTVTQRTLYPEADSAECVLEMPAAARFKLRFRRPAWTGEAGLRVNGEAVAFEVVDNWIVAEREWQPGDVVGLTLPMSLRAQPVDSQHPDRLAILHGPLVMAQDEACCRRPFTMAADTALETRLLKDGANARFRITNTVPERHTRYLVPLYSLPKGWPYWIYFDVHAQTLY